MDGDSIWIRESTIGTDWTPADWILTPIDRFVPTLGFGIRVVSGSIADFKITHQVDQDESGPEGVYLLKAHLGTVDGGPRSANLFDVWPAHFPALNAGEFATISFRNIGYRRYRLYLKTAGGDAVVETRKPR